MNTKSIRRTTLWLATLCMSLMLVLPVVQANAKLRQVAGGGITINDPSGGQGGG